MFAERLEDRALLSTISIFAAGDEGLEQLGLLIDQNQVETWTVGTGAATGNFQTYTYDLPGNITPEQVRVALINDVYDPANGIDYNLRVDAIEIDGVRFETEDPSVLSTATWVPGIGIEPGYYESEYLHTVGYFQYAQTNGSPSTVRVRARGDVGGEQFRLLLGDFVARTFTTTTSLQTFEYVASSTVVADQVRVEFFGDVYDPGAGIDTNLTVDSIEIDGTTYETEDPSTYSTGTWLPADGIQPGYRLSETLHANGFFQYADSGEPTETVIEVRARGDEGTEQFELSIGGSVVGTYLVSTSFQTFTYTANNTVFANLVRVNFINDQWDPAAGIDTNLQVDFMTIDGTVYQTEAPTVYSTGTWVPGVGLVPGFNESEFLHANGYFEYGGVGEIQPNGSGFTTELIASGLVQPIAFAVAPDGRIFVTEKEGRVKVVENGAVVSTFLDINLEVQSGHDRGLMGIALDPDFASNGHVYLNFSEELDPANPDDASSTSPAAGRLIRISASASNPNVADPATRIDVLTGHQMSHHTHAVGDIDFDNDGNLIFTWGDGGFDVDLVLEAQDPDSKQGKLFRVDRFTFEGVPGNPHYEAANPDSVASKVWALGIRNSWKFTVDRPSGDVYLGEVTDSGPEEINVMRADGSTIPNFGWPYFEDNIPTGYGPAPSGFTYERAFIALPHTEAGGGDAIVGGAVYRGDSYPDIYDGRYFFGNFNQGTIYSADANGDYQQFGDAGDYPGLVDMQLGPDGHLWVMSLFTGNIERLVSTGEGSTNTSPIVVASASLTAGTGPLTVTFDAAGSNDPDGDPIEYAWDFDTDGTIDSTEAVASFTYSTIGRTNATLVVSDDRGGFDTKILEIDVLSEPDVGNLALGRPTLQSMTAGSALASRAVDGNAGSDTDTVARTVSTRTPLWEVDLGSVRTITQLEIYIPSGTELSDYWILVSDNPFSSGNLDAARNDPGVWTYHNAGSILNGFETLDINTTGRFLRIQRAGTDDYLALTEVRVLGS